MLLSKHIFLHFKDILENNTEFKKHVALKILPVKKYMKIYLDNETNTSKFE